MNPFLHSTVARPLPSSQARLRSPRAAPGRRTPRHRRLARALGAAGLAALAWSGGALAVDLNTASVAQLQDVRGIGPRTAQIIHQERERGGRYTSFEDLSDRVRGIGPKRAQTLRAAGLTIGADPGGSGVPPGAAGAKAAGKAPAAGC